MQSQDAFVVVVDYDPNAALDKFVGLDPMELVAYLNDLIRSAKHQIEKARPDTYEAQGELHQIIWLKGNRNGTDLISSVFRLLLRLVRQVEQVNANYKRKGIPPSKLHAGFGEGIVEFGSGSVSGNGIVNARACAEYARKTNSVLAVTPAILQRTQSEVLQSAAIGFSGVSQRFVTVDENVLFAMAGPLEAE